MSAVDIWGIVIMGVLFTAALIFAVAVLVAVISDRRQAQRVRQVRDIRAMADHDPSYLKNLLDARRHAMKEYLRLMAQGCPNLAATHKQCADTLTREIEKLR